MDHTRISGVEPLSLILSQTKEFQKVESGVRKCQRVSPKSVRSSWYVLYDMFIFDSIPLQAQLSIFDSCLSKTYHYNYGLDAYDYIFSHVFQKST